VWTLFKTAGPLLLIAGIAVAVVGSGAAKHLSLEALRHARTALVLSVHAHPFAAPALYIAAFILVAGLALPGALFMTLTGGLLFGALFGTAAALAGASTGALLMFLVARSTLGAWMRRRIRSDSVVGRLESEIRRHAFSYLLSLRLMPGAPFALVNLVAGFVNMPLSTYVADKLLGMAPSTLIYASVGRGSGRCSIRAGRRTCTSSFGPRSWPLCLRLRCSRPLRT